MGINQCQNFLGTKNICILFTKTRHCAQVKKVSFCFSFRAARCQNISFHQFHHLVSAGQPSQGPCTPICSLRLPGQSHCTLCSRVGLSSGTDTHGHTVNLCKNEWKRLLVVEEIEVAAINNGEKINLAVH